jgi:hypothetical protein
MHWIFMELGKALSVPVFCYSLLAIGFDLSVTDIFYLRYPYHLAVIT